MPLANSLQSLMPERSSPGQNSPHGPAPAPLCGPRRGEGRDQAAGTSQPSPVTPKPTAGPGTAGAAGDQRRPSFYAPRLPGLRVRNTWGPLFPSNTHPDHHHHFLQTLSAHWSKRKGTCKGKKVLCPLPQVLYSREANEGKRQGRCPGEDSPPPNLRRRLPGRPQERRHRAGSGTLPQTDSNLGEPPSATSSSPDQSPPHTLREEGAPAPGEREVWKGPGEVTQYLSLRAAGSDADDRVGGEGIRWARVFAGSGGPWASAPPSAAASCRRSPGCARRSAGYLWPSRLARRPLGPPPRPPALGGWGRSAPQRPVRARRRPGARWGPPALPPSRWPRSAASSLPGRRAFGACREASLSRGRGARACNWVRFSEHRLPGLLGGRGNSGGETILQPVAKCVFQCIRSSLS